MASAFVKHCIGCGGDTLHNPMKGDKPEHREGRCTYCGYPVKSNVEGKKLYWQGVQQRQAARKRLLG